MPLTDIAIRKAKGRDKPFKLTDEKGLYLIVRPDGAKWWRQDFTLPGLPRRTMGLGTYPDVDLSAARGERDRIKKLVADGIDPVRERKGTNDEDATFKSVALKWMLSQRDEWTARNYDVLMRRLERLIFPDLGRKDIRRIEPTDLLATIRKIEAEGSTELPGRMNGICGRIFRFAIAEGWAARDPSNDIRDALKKRPPVKHHAFIRPAKMGAFLNQLEDSLDEEPDTVDAMRFTILTAVRSAEARFAHVAEFEGLDRAAPQWRIPPERMKRRREHLVPLSKQAASLVRKRIAMLRPGQTLLFGRPTRSGVISENTMIFALYRLGYRSRATMHGFRSTFSTHANDTTTVDERGLEVRLWDPDWIERQLAHVPENKVRSAYNSAEYLPARRRLLQWWADWLDEQQQLARIIG